MNAPLRNALVMLPQADSTAPHAEPDVCPLCGMVHMPEPMAKLAPVRAEKLHGMALDLLRITTNAWTPLHNSEAVPMPAATRKRMKELSAEYRKQSGRGYVDAENQEWFSLPMDLRMAILLLAGVDGDLQALANRDWRETPPPERAAIKTASRAIKRHSGRLVALASLW